MALIQLYSLMTTGVSLGHTLIQLYICMALIQLYSLMTTGVSLGHTLIQLY